MALREADALLRAYPCRTAEGVGQFHIGHVNPRYVRRDLNASQWTPTCPTLCEDDCEAACHEGHRVYWRREHRPEDCPSNYATRRRAEEAG
jgi:hypothetical protein